MEYWDAQQWILDEYGVEVNYQRIREYLTKHFGTKVKQPRKSHINKDPNGKATFKGAAYHSPPPFKSPSYHLTLYFT